MRVMHHNQATHEHRSWRLSAPSFPPFFPLSTPRPLSLARQLSVGRCECPSHVNGNGNGNGNRKATRRRMGAAMGLGIRMRSTMGAALEPMGKCKCKQCERAPMQRLTRAARAWPRRLCSGASGCATDSPRAGRAPSLRSGRDRPIRAARSGLARAHWRAWIY